MKNADDITHQKIFHDKTIFREWIKAQGDGIKVKNVAIHYIGGNGNEIEITVFYTIPGEKI